MTAKDAIIKTLRNRSRPITAADVAAITKRKVSTIRRTLAELEYEGHVRVTGTKPSGFGGRGSNLYRFRTA